MTCQLFVERMEEGNFQAVPLAFPECVGVGPTRDEAIEQARGRILARLGQGEIVNLDIEVPQNPWLRGFGMFRDEPMFNEVLADIEDYRREVDAVEMHRTDVSP